MIDQFKKIQHTWDSIAKSFDTTRTKPWEFVTSFVKGLPDNSIVGDVGCGNGRHSLLCASHCKRVIALDISRNLLKHAQQHFLTSSVKNSDLLQANLLCMPLKEETVDSVLYVAALHNIPKRIYRQQSLQEVRRVLKPQGTALISVWSQEQDRFRENKEIHKASSQKEKGDITVWWKQHGLCIPRFYHLYTKEEFREDLSSAQLKIQRMRALKISSQHHPDNYVAEVFRE